MKKALFVLSLVFSLTACTSVVKEETVAADSTKVAMDSCCVDSICVDSVAVGFTGVSK